MTNKISAIGIVGAGIMGSGIAQVAVRADFSVTLHDLREEILDRARQIISANLQLEVEKNRLTAKQRQKAISQLRFTTDMALLRDTGLVIETITENVEKKSELFSNLDSMLSPGVILASNSLSISITRLAAATARPDRVIGMHFINPVPIMKLVELVRGLATSQQTFDIVKRLAGDFGKTAIESKDAPGFISNRILMLMINEAVFTLYEGVGTIESIDEIMKLGMGHPMGPLQQADFIGLDVCLAVMNVLHEGFNDPKYRPCPLLRKYVEAGWLGCKSGRGFYTY